MNRMIVLPNGSQVNYDYATPAIKAAADSGVYKIVNSTAPTSTAQTTSPQNTSTVAPANTMLDTNINDIRSRLKSGQLSVQQAIQSAMNAGGNTISQSELYNKLFGGLGPITIGGQQYAVNPSDGSVTRTSTQVVQSNTTGNGTTSTTSAVSPTGYTVKQGDSLSNIAANNGMSVQQLLALNPQYAANPNLIRPGELVNLQAPQQNQTTPTNNGGTGGGTVGTDNGQTGGTGISTTSTGNADLDKILAGITGVANGLVSSGYTIPPGLQITPELTSQFLSWAHQAVDPQTQQLITSKIADINANLGNLGTQYGLSRDQTVQDFGDQLASEQNSSGNAGTAFSGLRGLGERNMAASTNRTLSGLMSNAAYNIGSTLRSGAADVGADNAARFTLPNLSSGYVDITGGSRGNFTPGNTYLEGNYGYNPSTYQAGNIPTAGNTAVNDLEANYIKQYGTLAGANSGRSIKDIIGGISGLPAGAAANY